MAIAAELARLIGALHLCIDSIEQAIRVSGVVSQPLNDAGYREHLLAAIHKGSPA
jgi:hypothetical protein